MKLFKPSTPEQQLVSLRQRPESARSSSRSSHAVQLEVPRRPSPHGGLRSLRSNARPHPNIPATYSSSYPSFVTRVYTLTLPRQKQPGPSCPSPVTRVCTPTVPRQIPEGTKLRDVSVHPNIAATNSPSYPRPLARVCTPTLPRQKQPGLLEPSDASVHPQHCRDK